MPTRHSKVSCLALRSDACPAAQQSRMPGRVLHDMEGSAEHVAHSAFCEGHHPSLQCCMALIL